MTPLLLALLILPLPARPAFGGSLNLLAAARSVRGGHWRHPDGAATSGAAADTTAGTIAGRLAADGGGPPLAFATVEAEGPGGSRLVHADGVGAYRISGLEPGVWRLSARALDYASTKVAVSLPPGGHVRLNLALALDPVRLPSLRIAARRGLGDETLSPADPAADARNPARTVDLVALSPAGASATVGLASAAREVLAGAPRTKAGTLYVPASVRDGGRVLLDGAPVVAPVELAGLLSPFPAGVPGTVRIDRAGAPSRFRSGGLGLLQLDTRQPARNRIRASGTLGQLRSSVQAEAPLGAGDFLVGARTLSAEGPAFLEGAGGSPPYGYADALARVDLPAGPGSLSATGFWNRESLRGPQPADATLLAWGNAAGSVRYRVPVGRGGLRLEAAAGRFHTAVPWGDAGGRLQEYSLDARAGAEAFGQAGPVTVSGGLAWQGMRLRRAALGPGGGAPAVPAADLAGGVASPYVEANLQLAPALSLRAGVRADAAAGGAVGWDPRARLEWRTGPRLSLYVAAGRSHQLLEREAVTGCDPVSGACGPSRLILDGASHLAAGFRARPSARLTLGVDAYLAEYAEPVTGLRARSAGIELRGAWQGDGWSTWLDYSLAGARSALAGGIDAGAPGLQQRLLAGLSAEIPPAVRLALRLQVTSGQPYAALPVVGWTSPQSMNYPGPASNPPVTGGQASAVTMPGSWARLDGTISRSWRTRVFGADVTLTPYLEVLNATGTSDAPFYWAASGASSQPIGTVPLLAAVGLRWGL